MPESDRLLDLVVEWEELREAGQSVKIEDLCRDCPELLPALRERLKALGALDAVLSDAGTTCADTAATIMDSASDRSAGPEEALPEIPGYQVLRELGRGGMGVVYEARQNNLNRLVAVKLLPGGRQATAAAQARFKAEVESIGRLQHPNLIQVFEVGELNGRGFYSMEYMADGSLEDRIASTPLPPRKAAELVEILARAMQVVHERGVVHRDLKPANILLTGVDAADERSGVIGFGRPKISDFGLAKRMDAPSGPTLTEHVLGTPSYMAPEQATGHSRQVGPATDIYSLGAILYRLLIGRPPFVGESAMEIIMQVAAGDPIPPRQLQPRIPIDLETICLKCLNKQPGQRYASAAALAEDLRRYLANEPILARPIGWSGRLAKWVRRRPAVASLIGVSGLSVVLLLASAWWFNQRLARELNKTRQAHQRAVAAGHDLKSALANEVAAAIDADFRQLELVPQSMVALLALRVNWDEQELEGWTRALVEKDKRIFGISLAFEPQRFVGSRVYDEYCLYVFEDSQGTHTTQLLPPWYPPPNYRERDWYTGAKTTGQRLWSEPYLGQRANNTPMISYSCPIYREGQFCGVVAADLTIEYFRELHTRLQQRYLGKDSSSFVISPGGTILYHPDPQYEYPAPNSTLDRISAAPDFLAMIHKMQQQETGLMRATDFVSNQPAAFYFARIPATGCHFVLVQFGPTAVEGLDQLPDR